MPKEGVPEGQLYPILLRLNLAEALKDTGNADGAREQMAIAEQEIAKINVEGPAKAEFLRVRASIKAADEDFNGAEADLKEAQKLDPNNPLITLQYANLLWKAGARRITPACTSAFCRVTPKTALLSKRWAISRPRCRRYQGRRKLLHATRAGVSRRLRSPISL